MGFQEIVKKYEGNMVLRVIVNLIPYVGGSLDVALSKWSQIKQRRVDELLGAINNELLGIQEDSINNEYLESDEFYDLIYQIVNHAIENRCPEPRRAYARVVRSAIQKEETVANLEDIIRQIKELREKDILFLRAIKKTIDLGRDLTGNTLAFDVTCESGLYDALECERMLYRFENLGLLDHPRNTLRGRGTMDFHKLPLFDKLVSYLGL